jgi:accessory gene regulator B
MRFVGRWSYSCAKHLAIALNENHQKRAIYYYGFFVVIGAFVKAFFMMTAAAILGAVIPTALIIFVFGSLRMLAGGYHMDTYGKCIITSLGMFVLAGTIIQYTYQYWDPLYIIIFTLISFLTGVLILLKWAPGDTPNKPITDPKDIRKFKVLSIIYAIGWMAISLLLMYFGYNKYVLAGTFGFIMEVFTVSPAGYRFFDMISGKAASSK